MKRDRSFHSQNVEIGPEGHPLTHDELEMRKKYTDFSAVKFPEVNSFDIKVPDYADKCKKVQLFTYRYPSVIEKPRAVIQYVHGMGDYAGRYAYLGKEFAEAGYDFVSMD